ncbi:MAG TPA: IS1595 family transposase [Tepidisphaeraceae bacterium]|jgi:transposase-like protein|nr:IS1595 family transposase [Tepidisphaeraceae bacterium]
MKVEIRNPKTLTEAVAYFADPDTSLRYMVATRWPDGVRCPHCGSDNVHFLANQRRWKCAVNHPRRQFSAKVGTIFEESPLPLEKWLAAVWLETNAKNSISSYEVARALGITQKSAWFMLHRVRYALHVGSFDTKLQGIVEADETVVGGLRANMHKAKQAKLPKGTGMTGKTVVMGLLDRHSGKNSTVRTEVLTGNVNKATLHPVIHKHVEPGSHLYTDAHGGYRGLDPTFTHKFIDHAEKYVEGAVHTNGIENFWALFKRCIKGTHISIEPFHLAAYVDSEAFRFNNRKVKDGDRFMLAMQGVSGKRLTYKSLIGKTPLEGLAASDNGAENGDFN